MIKDRKISYFAAQPNYYSRVEKLYLAKIIILTVLRYIELKYPQFDRQEFVKKIGTSSLDDEDLFGKYYINDFDLLIDELRKVDPEDKALCLNLGRNGVASKIGSFSFFIQNSPNFIDTLKKSSTFSHIITNILSTIIVEKTSEHFQLKYHFSREALKFKEQTKALILEISYGVLANRYNEIAFNKDLTLEFHSNYSHTLSDEEITAILGHKFVSRSEMNIVFIPLEVESISNQKYEVNLPQVVNSGLSKHLEAHNIGSLSSKITNLLEVNPEFSLDEISKKMLVSKRTLQRRLQEQNVSFTSLKQNAINAKSIELLELKKYTIEEIARMLGYSTSASFVHAFTKWHGVSPSQYLKGGH